MKMKGKIMYSTKAMLFFLLLSCCLLSGFRLGCLVVCHRICEKGMERLCLLLGHVDSYDCPPGSRVLEDKRGLLFEVFFLEDKQGPSVRYATVGRALNLTPKTV